MEGLLKDRGNGILDRVSEGGPKVYRYDFVKVYGAGLDIDSIMLNGGMLLNIYTLKSYAHFYSITSDSYLFFMVDPDDNNAFYFVDFVIDGDDLKIKT